MAADDTDAPQIPAVTFDGDQVRQLLFSGLPYSDFQYVTVTFGTSGTDTDIRHTLTPRTVDGVDYHIVRADRACAIYHDQSGTRKPWGTGYVILRCSVSSAVVTLLLTVRQT